SITLRSIDLGAMEKVNTYEELCQFNKVGSPFSIPKAALVLAGFHPDFCAVNYPSLQEQLRAFGAGIEMTTLSAIPAGSGLGTSSILASTVLGAVNEFCGLGWDKYDISNATLVLEQLLTTGGGWQDQYGGVLSGVKLLQTQRGWRQQPLARWLPDHLFTQTDTKKCHLLYYTGITRTAKGILAEIVRGMFLNNTRHLDILAQMKEHALEMSDVIQRNDFEGYGRMVRKTWAQNQALDSGTNPPSVQQIARLIDDYCLGYKLPGAGGGGYLYMVAKDEDAAMRIRKTLLQNAPNAKARFVEMELSQKGLEVSKS
ncbi:MAG: bifunctional fucokinase/L-fucose-1-P-guanylyltransferase, partial [Bacteroidaceae bacterium]|nr:bifunctional fucokinase/L-fucose-1-P-guanylyltransferase [Bacteroidaceae bacterium]